MPGYPKEVLVDTRSFVERLKCVICHLLLRLAVQSTCGHRYCELCIKEQISSDSGARCPACPSDSPDGEWNEQEIYPDFHARKELKTLAAKCPNEGCPWRGTFQQYTEHEELCDLTEIKCFKAGCGKKLRRGDLNYHLDKDCPMRDVKCRHCGEKLAYKDMKKHNAECPRVNVTCSDCNKKMPRAQLQDHQDFQTGDCPKRKQECPYAKYGCTSKIVGDNMDKHLQMETSYHAQLQNKVFDELALKVRELIAKLNIQNSISSAPVGKLVVDGAEPLDNGACGGDATTSSEKGISKIGNGEIDQLIEQLKDVFVMRVEEKDLNKPKTSGGNNNASPRSGNSINQERKIKELENNMNDKVQELEQLKTLYAVLDKRNETFQEVVAVLNNQLEALAEKSNTLERQNRHLHDIIEQQERQIHAHDQMLTVKNVALAEQELRIQSLESSSFNGILVWKISEYSRRRRDAVSGKTTSFYSPAFYTSYHGYKMCARIYLNGDGMGKGTHVSLFFVVMKGRYDNILRWPFRQKVTFMMVDQGNREHVVDAFRPDPTSSSFKKPTHEMNIASGCPLFVSLSLLENGNYSYVKDDCLFVKVVVDVSDLERI